LVRLKIIKIMEDENMKQYENRITDFVFDKDNNITRMGGRFVRRKI